MASNMRVLGRYEPLDGGATVPMVPLSTVRNRAPETVVGRAPDLVAGGDPAAVSVVLPSDVAATNVPPALASATALSFGTIDPDNNVLPDASNYTLRAGLWTKHSGRCSLPSGWDFPADAGGYFSAWIRPYHNTTIGGDQRLFSKQITGMRTGAMFQVVLKYLTDGDGGQPATGYRFRAFGRFPPPFSANFTSGNFRVVGGGSGNIGATVVTHEMHSQLPVELQPTQRRWQHVVIGQYAPTLQRDIIVDAQYVLSVQHCPMGGCTTYAYTSADFHVGNSGQVDDLRGFTGMMADVVLLSGAAMTRDIARTLMLGAVVAVPSSVALLSSPSSALGDSPSSSSSISTEVTGASDQSGVLIGAGAGAAAALIILSAVLAVLAVIVLRRRRRRGNTHQRRDGTTTVSNLTAAHQTSAYGQPSLPSVAVYETTDMAGQAAISTNSTVATAQYTQAPSRPPQSAAYA
eukprot:CAMPEP_0198333756 /NCGR_PEP_ID=MMETSP1450-20131203/19156_1 /TAXON_ID=753684 ORGANISM="Madagascaria erythrocladiodes, Strain CCMP3234" /NCGR_SAMPLE_ID=MMETSP1450 /ASSEMBLY_ACC=CAM_ASM_001115 /LENGTH=460 /DNA_ID=CAMNT_0044038291 /DNA_START=15 /DNA_END=1393 /DNA_ORIENTATION=+